MGEIKLSPIAYLDMYRHCTAKGGENSSIYGLIKGSVEDGQTIIKGYVPLSHSNNPIDFERNHNIFHEIEELGEDIIGWVRSFTTDEIVLSELEKKNHLYMQTAYSANAVAIFLPKSGDQFGMQVKHFKDPLPEIDITSSLEDIDWNFGEIEDLDDLFYIIMDLNQRRNKKAPLMEEKFQ